MSAVRVLDRSWLVCLASRRVMLGLIAMSSLEKACLSWQTRQTSKEVHITIQIFYITVNMHFACLSSRTDYVLRQEKEKERISENQNKHLWHVVIINWLMTNFAFSRKIQIIRHYIPP